MHKVINSSGGTLPELSTQVISKGKEKDREWKGNT